MKKRRNVWLVLLALVLVAVACWVLMPKGPQYGGKGLTECLEDADCILMDCIGNGSIRPRIGNDHHFFTVVSQGYPVLEEWSVIDTNALPFLRKMLLKKDSALRTRVDPLIRKVPFLERRFPLPVVIRRRAMGMFELFGRDGIPLLIEVCRDEEPDIEVKREATKLFLDYPEKSRDALPILMLYQKSSDTNLATLAYHAYALIGGPTFTSKNPPMKIGN